MPFSTFLTAPNIVGSESQALSVSSSSCSSASSLFEKASDYQSDITPPSSPPEEEFWGDIGLQGVAPRVVVESASYRDVHSLERATPKVANCFAGLLFDDDSDESDNFDMVQCLRERLMRGNTTAASRRALEIMAGNIVSAAPSEPLTKLNLAPQVDDPAEDWSGDFGDSENHHGFSLLASASSYVVTDDIDDIDFGTAFDAELQSPVEAPIKLSTQSKTYEFNDAAFELDSPIESPKPDIIETGTSQGLTSSSSMNARVGLGLLGVALSLDVASIDDTLPNPHGEAPEKQYSLESPSPLSLSSPMFTMHGTLTATIRLSPSMLSPKPRPRPTIPLTFSKMSPELSLPTPRSLTVTTSSISLTDGSHYTGNLTDLFADSIFSPALSQPPATSFAAQCTLEYSQPMACTGPLGGVGLGLPSHLANRAPRKRDVSSRPLVSYALSPDAVDMGPLQESLSQALMERLVTPRRDYLRIQHYPRRTLYAIEEVNSPLCASPLRGTTAAPTAFRSRIPKPTTRLAATFGCGIAASTRLSPPKSSRPLSLIPRLQPSKLKFKFANPSRLNLRNKKVFSTPSRIPRYVPSAARSLRARAPSRIPRISSLTPRR